MKARRVQDGQSLRSSSQQRLSIANVGRRVQGRERGEVGRRRPFKPISHGPQGQRLPPVGNARAHAVVGAVTYLGECKAQRLMSDWILQAGAASESYRLMVVGEDVCMYPGQGEATSLARRVLYEVEAGARGDGCCNGSGGEGCKCGRGPF